MIKVAYVGNREISLMAHSHSPVNFFEVDLSNQLVMISLSIKGRYLGFTVEKLLEDTDANTADQETDDYEGRPTT